MQFRMLLTVLVLTSLVTSSAYAFKVVETYCNDKAKRGEWTVGIKDKKRITSITEEFDFEHQKLIGFLDGMPIKIDEASILASMPLKPQQVTKGRLQWEIPGKKSNLYIVIYQYKGCVSQIDLMSSKNRNFYSRPNILSSSP